MATIKTANNRRVHWMEPIADGDKIYNVVLTGHNSSKITISCIDKKAADSLFKKLSDMDKYYIS